MESNILPTPMTLSFLIILTNVIKVAEHSFFKLKTKLK